MSHGDGFTFEVDPADALDALDLELLETGNPAGNHDVEEEYLGDPNFNSQPLLDSISPDEKVGDFVDVLPQMIDLIPDGKVKKLASIEIIEIINIEVFLFWFHFSRRERFHFPILIHNIIIVIPDGARRDLKGRGFIRREGHLPLRCLCRRKGRSN